MKKVKVSSIITLIAGIVSFLWLMAQFLCISDIAKGTEPDLSGEWFIVSYSYLPLTIFHLAVFLTIILFLISQRKQG